MSEELDEIAIKVEQVRKTYKLYNRPIDRLKESVHPFGKVYHRPFHAINGVSFEIKKGETLGLIGKNGSGKSTLLKMITGVLTPTSGSIQVNGKISALLELGAGFNPEFTGIENIYLNGTFMGYSKQEMDEKLRDILAFADIGDFVYQPVKTYSSGMFVRLAFAVSISVDPDILIVDEALAVGDITFQAKCYRKFQEFQEKGKTILFVTHSMETVLRYCTKGVVLIDGQIMAEGTPKETVDIYKKYLARTYSSEARGQSNDAAGSIQSWKTSFEASADMMEYGGKSAEIVDYGIFDQNGELTQAISSDEEIEIRMKVIFHETVSDPIFAFTIKDIKGLELAGTNSAFEEVATGLFHAGETAVVTFRQKLNFRGESYALSLGCVKYEGDELVVFHRLYDALLFRTILHKPITGLVNLDSTVTIERKEGRNGTT